MRQAVTAPAFHIEFEKQKHHCRKADAILKSLYFLNFGCFLAGLIVVSIRQSSGYYQVSTYYQAYYSLINALHLLTIIFIFLLLCLSYSATRSQPDSVMRLLP